MVSETGRILKLSLVLLTLLLSCSREKFSLGTEWLKIGINGKGFITSLTDIKNSVDYLPHGKTDAILTLYRDPSYILPVSARFDRQGGKLIISYPNGSEATVKVDTKGDYIRLELVSLEPRNGVQAIVWGPFSTTIKDKIGETICVVRNKNFAFGLQALNINTIEGMPDGDDNSGGGGVIDPLPGQSLPDSLKSKIGQPVEVNVNVTGDIPEYIRLYRGSAAVAKPYGSELHLFSRDRRQPRVIRNWLGNKTYTQFAEPVDVDFAGSAVAIFGCPEPMTLDFLEKIELGEGLPHPMLDGVWIKRSKISGEAYMLNEGDPEKALKYARECGFRLVHVGDVFQTWGHFGYSLKRFPGGTREIANVVAEARKDSISIGVHTLTMFTQKNDPYITPVPSDSLCKTGSSELMKDIGAGDETLYIKDPLYFRYLGNTHTVKVEKELINYRKVSDDEPWRLVGCQRGVYGTKAVKHNSGHKVDKLTNDSYSGFYPDLKLQDSYALRLAQVCNETGIDLMDFDGFAGESPTGQGSYGAARFIDTWYKNIDRYRLTCGAGTFHYYWHIYAFMNWGEPWYNALRESQVNYRIENQRFFDRNLMPGMLGWFTLNPEFRPEEVEWIQARSAAFNAGYLLRVDESIEQNGFRDQLLEAVREWQKARRSGAFTPELRELMKDPKKEFHLEKTGEKTWQVNQVNLLRGFTHKYHDVQTGEPLSSKFSISNPFDEQPVQFYITAFGPSGTAGPGVSHIQLKINNYQTLDLNTELKPGFRIYCDGKRIFLCDNYWKKIKPIWDGKIPLLDKGSSEIVMTSDISNSSFPELAVEFKTVGPPVVIHGTR